MKRKITFVAFLMFKLIVISQNVMISDISGNDYNYGPNEPSIIMDPNNTDVLVAADVLSKTDRDVH